MRIAIAGSTGLVGRNVATWELVDSTRTPPSPQPPQPGTTSPSWPVSTGHAPGVHILRACQFLDFAGQMLDWNREGDIVTIPEMKTQPVAVEEIARLLVKIADATETRTRVELAGPEPEDLADLVRQVAAQRGQQVTVVTAVESRGMAEGACRPGADAILAGPDFTTWLAAQA